MADNRQQGHQGTMPPKTPEEQKPEEIHPKPPKISTEAERADKKLARYAVLLIADYAEGKIDPSQAVRSLHNFFDNTLTEEEKRYLYAGNTGVNAVRKIQDFAGALTSEVPALMTKVKLNTEASA